MDQDGFRDRNHRYTYLIACENARRIAEDPAVLALGMRHLERFARADPSRRDGYALWVGLLREGPRAVIERLTDRSAHGDFARETAPAFGSLPAPVRARLVSLARSPLAKEPVRASVAE